MCNFYSFVPQQGDNLVKEEILTEEQLAKLKDSSMYFASGFDHPLMPVITQLDNDVQLMQWGLIPHWTRNETQANEIQNKTLNARAETLLEKASFKDSARSKRCLVLCSGFFEWHTKNKQKYPHYIRMKDESLFVFAGIWSEWTNPKSGEISKTYSIVTTEANELMARVHNTKQRMPVILDADDAKTWLSPTLSDHEIAELLAPFDPEQMTAYSIKRFSPQKSKEANRPEIKAFYRYPELGDIVSGTGSGEWTLFDF